MQKIARIIVNTFLMILLSCCHSFAQKIEKPNIILIAVDDLNDWLGAMGVNSQMLTSYQSRKKR